MMINQTIQKQDIEFIYLDFKIFGLIVKILELDLLIILRVHIKIIVAFWLQSMIFDKALDNYVIFNERDLIKINKHLH